MKPLLILGSLILLVNACTRTNENPEDGNIPLSGTMYINEPGRFMSLNLADSTLYWSLETVNLSASFNNPMVFDSNSFYHANYNGVTAYSIAVGTPRWSFSWPAMNASYPIFTYVQPAFNDTLVIVATPTTPFWFGQIYCADKRTGSIKWQRQLDEGDYWKNYYSTTQLAGHLVYALTRDNFGHKHLTAFDVETGNTIWTSEENDNLSAQFQLREGKIYSTSNRMIYCYDATTGRREWEVDTEIDQFERTATFFDNGKIILVRMQAVDYTFIVINRNGMVESRESLSLPYTTPYPDAAQVSCNFAKGNMFISWRYAMDTICLESLTFPALKRRWQKKIYAATIEEVPAVQTDEYLIFPINIDYNNAKSLLYFVDFNGNIKRKIPFKAVYNAGLVYRENGVTFVQHNNYVGKSNSLFY